MIQRMFDDKEIMNPMNPEEVFSCSDLVNDWKICRREFRLKTDKKSQNHKSCWDYRTIAHKCYWKEEDDFVDLLIEQHQEKKKFYEFLEANGSILADKYKGQDGIFSVRNTR